MTRPDAFPHTRRPLPWVLAAFIVVVFWVPLDQTMIKVHLPFDSKFDRFAVVMMVLAWVFFRGDQRSVWRTNRSRAFVAAASLFVAVVVTGVLINASRAVHLNEWNLATKQLMVLFALVAVGWFALTALRLDDLPGFATLLVGLGCFLAVAMLVESHTGYNVFYSLSGTLLSPIAHVNPPDTNINPGLTGMDRVLVEGPTSDPLAAVTMLGITMPFALIRMLDAESKGVWIRNAVIVACMVAAAVATQKKTGVLALVAAFIFVAAHRPRKAVRILPLSVVLFGFVHLVSPGSLGTVLNLGSWFNNGSSAHRAADLTAIMPDVVTHPFFGRGFGTIDISKPNDFRILDDQFLGILWQTGILGLATYVAMIVSPIVGARHARHCRDPKVEPVAIAASAGCVAYFVVNGLFDALGFLQGPYLFFIVGAICAVTSEVARPATVPRLSRSTPRPVAAHAGVP